MFEIEKKVLSLFLTDVGFDSSSIEDILSKSKILERDIDPVGFYTTINIPEQYRNVFIDNPNWSKASGKTKNGTLIGFIIFPPDASNNNIVLEGYTYEGEYPKDEKDYKIGWNQEIFKDTEILYY
jgi:hypothetical protein